MKKTLLLILVLAAGILQDARAQGFVSDVSKRGTTAAPFLSIGQGARATAMGGAFVAIADDQSSIYWNPAGLADLEGYGVIFDHTKWLADISYNFIGATVSMGSYGTIGLSMTASSIGEMKVTTIDEPNGTGEMFGVSDAAISLAYALRLTDDFSIGFNPKYVYQKIWKMSAGAMAFDVGVKYRTPFKGVTLGMSVSNFGEKMRMEGNNTLVLYDAAPTVEGNNGRIGANLQTDAWALPLNFRVGLAYRPEISDMHKLVIAVDAMHPNDDYESVNVGGEYTFNNFISLRGGYKTLFLKESLESFTLGVGIQQALMGNVTLKFDYAYQDFGRLTNIQKVSIGVTF